MSPPEPPRMAAVIEGLGCIVLVLVGLAVFLWVLVVGY